MILNKGVLTCTNSRIFAQTNTVTELARMSDVTSEASIRASADTNLQNQVNSLNSSVSNGKTLIANAITGKGVATSSSDTFATMANNINNIASAPRLVASGSLYNGGASVDAGGCDYAECVVSGASATPSSFTIMRGGTVNVRIRISSYETTGMVVSLSSDGSTLSKDHVNVTMSMTYKCYTQ